MNLKFIGGILLIVGTSIGGGMLALPVATAQSGFMAALVLLFGAWLLMTFGAFLILEVNLWFPQDSNLVSMVRHTLGPFAEVVAWFCYLLLLYCLLAAYIAGGSDVFNLVLRYAHINLHHWTTTVLFLLVWGFVVFKGIETIDRVNRILMFVKFTSLALLLLFITPHIHIQALMKFHSAYLVSGLTVVITAFGFATIVPSLRSYFKGDVKILRRIILIGSLIPLICYIAWVAAVIGEIPMHGTNSLMTIIHSKHTTAMLTQSLIIFLHNSWVGSIAGTFTSICVITSFLGVALCLSDFLADGLNKKKRGSNRYLIYSLTFIPPFALVLIKPGLFLLGLSYAGILCIILLVLFPSLMAWRGRYQLNLSSSYQVWGGRVFLLIAMVVSMLILIHECLIAIKLL